MEQNRLIKELTQGKDLVVQLMKHMNPSSSSDTRQFLVERILSSYEKALLMLNSVAHSGEVASAHLVISTTEAANDIPLALPHSPLADYSPRSEISDQTSKDQCHRNVFKKRKTTQPKWTEQVKVCSRTGLEGPLDDGHSWRKYGQKDILGASYPRLALSFINANWSTNYVLKKYYCNMFYASSGLEIVMATPTKVSFMLIQNLWTNLTLSTTLLI